MARQRIHTRIRVRVKKDGSINGGGYKACSNCGGDGIVKTRKKHK